MCNELLQTIQNFENLNILVIGDIILDRYIIGNVNKISKEAPVPVLDINETKNALGGAANVANCVKKLGAKCTIIGQIGNDNNGHILKNIFAESNINPILSINNRIITTTKNKILSKNQQMIRYDKENYESISSQFVRSFIDIKLDDFDAVIINDYGKGVITNHILKDINDICSKYNKPVYLDPTPKTNYIYEMENVYILLNSLESNQIDLTKFGTKIITKGEKGIEVINKNSDYIVKPIKMKHVWNSTGTEDVITTIFSLSITSGLDLFKSVLLSNIGARISSEYPITHPINKEELSQKVFAHFKLNLTLENLLNSKINLESES